MFRNIYILFVFILYFSLCHSQNYDVEEVLKLNGLYQTTVLKINNKGNVVGQQLDNSKLQAFFYDYSKKQISILDCLDDKYATQVLDINDNDRIIGYADLDEFSPHNGRVRKTHLIEWIDLKLNDLTILAGEVYAKSNQFFSVNNKDMYIGFGVDLCNKFSKFGERLSILIDSTRKKRKQNISIGKNNYTRLVAMNEIGDAVGGVLYNDDSFYGIGHGVNRGPASNACIWKNSKKQLVQIGNLSGKQDRYSFATSLNDKLEVVGGSEVEIYDSTNQNFWHAFLNQNNNLIDLGTLEEGEDSVALSINNSCEIIGISGGVLGHPTLENKRMKGFIWTLARGMEDLNSLTDSEWNIIAAKDINDSGQIVAFAIRNSEAYVVILNPKE